MSKLVFNNMAEDRSCDANDRLGSHWSPHCLALTAGPFFFRSSARLA